MNVPRCWRLRAQRLRMESSRCTVCGQVVFPPRPLCPDCAYIPVSTPIPPPAAIESPASAPIAWAALAPLPAA